MPDAGNIRSGILRVMPENVTAAWGKCAPMIEEVLAARRTHDAEDVRRMLMAGAAQLWVDWDGVEIRSCLITEFAVYPKGVWIRIWLGATMPDHRLDVAGLRGAMETWRQSNGARGYEVVGRHGWLKKFPDAKVEGLVMRLTL